MAFVDDYSPLIMGPLIKKHEIGKEEGYEWPSSYKLGPNPPEEQYFDRRESNKEFDLT